MKQWRDSGSEEERQKVQQRELVRFALRLIQEQQNFRTKLRPNTEDGSKELNQGIMFLIHTKTSHMWVFYSPAPLTQMWETWSSRQSFENGSSFWLESPSGLPPLVRCSGNLQYVGPSACPGTSEDWPRGAGQGGQGEGSQVFFRSSEGVTQFNQQILMLSKWVYLYQLIKKK